MRKKIGLLKIFFVVVAAFYGAISQAAEGNLLTDDESQKKYERKVQLQLADIGLSSRHATFPVVFCVENKSESAEKKLLKSVLGAAAGHCIPVGQWKFELSQSLENKASDTLFGRLAGKRYDVLKVKADKLSLKTLSETIEMDIGSGSQIKPFNFDTGDYSVFQSSVNEYLNKNIAPMMIGLLSKAKDARYQEMKDKERETFLATTAKELSVPANFIEKLMNSAFVFAVHSEVPTGSVTITKESKSHGIEFSTNVSVNLKSNLAIFRFNAEAGKFDFYKRISEKSGRVSASSHVYLFRPTSAGAITEPFEKSYIVAAKAAGIASNVALKEDDNFAIFSTIDTVEGGDFLASIGENEDLRIDAPYILYQYIDGKKTQMGWGKARTVASSETFVNNAADYQSRFDLIRGDMEKQDQLREHPWTGVFWYVGLANTTTTLTDFDGVDASGGGGYNGLNLGSKLDLGFMFNSPSKVEKWLEFNFNLGLSGGEDIVASLSGVKSTFEDTSTITASLDLVQRKHLAATGSYVGYKYGLGYYSLNGTEQFSGESLSISGFGLSLGLQAGYELSPNNTLYANIDYMLPLSTSAMYGDSKTGTEYEATLSPVISLTIGAAFHLRSIGPLAVFMD